MDLAVLPTLVDEDHAAQSARMLMLAEELITHGIRQRASMPIWKAAFHKVAQIAQERDWPHVNLTDTHAIVAHLANQADDRRISSLFAVARNSEWNYYDNFLPDEWIVANLEDIRTLISLLDNAHQTLPMELPMPDRRHHQDRQDGRARGGAADDPGLRQRDGAHA